MDDFDFLHGEWDVVNRRLTAPLSGRGEDTAGWEQAFSTDDGRTWETNWVQQLTRRPQPVDQPATTR
ncbi:hypothetical protein ABH931_006422 [Streptacidiphilus sp. MAP12-33]|uniref:hypothetical protein n=1 Tax=Streptacidiphilus sp. MAP12-33 TaxID=3156266 RepID=UPI003517B2C4